MYIKYKNIKATEVKRVRGGGFWGYKMGGKKMPKMQRKRVKNV
jgi:hypothetical protein